jgi:hypothetical protein
MSETAYDLDLDTRLDTGDGDHDRFSHYVQKDEATRAMVEGTTVTALCGKKWVPSRDPEKFPICKTCKELHATLDSN